MSISQDSPARRSPRRSGRADRAVLLIGSSGGGAATLGHTDPTALERVLTAQLAAIGGDRGVRIAAAQVVVCNEALDTASGDVRAALWLAGELTGARSDNLRCVFEGTLSEVNARARDVDVALAGKIVDFDGIVSVSADAREGGVNRRALAAAGRLGLPVAGTGGSGLAVAASELGCQLVGNAGGSVATTAHSKAIGIAAALAGAWQVPYTPKARSSGLQWHSVIDGCLPVALCVACTRTALDLLAPIAPVSIGGLREALGARALVPGIGAIAAHQRSGLGEIGMMGGALIGALSGESLLCAFVLASLFGELAPRALALCARMAIPATAATISVSGGVALACGACAYALAPLGRAATAALRAVLDAYLGGVGVDPSTVALVNVTACGALVGVVFNWGSRRGAYHTLFLPLVIAEMEVGSFALCGALDLLTLCVTSAGACAAQLAAPRVHGATADAERALARRGVRINLLYGDYIEACFPFLERDRALDLAVYVASAAAGAIVALSGARSSAYLPLPLAIALGSPPEALTLAALVAFALPFLAGVLCNAHANRNAPASAASPRPKAE